MNIKGWIQRLLEMIDKQEKRGDNVNDRVDIAFQALDDVRKEIKAIKNEIGEADDDSAKG